MLSTARTRRGTRQPCAAGTGNGRARRVGSLATEATMLKWTGRTALIAAVAIMTLGCVRGLAAPTYKVTSYETKTECETAQQAAMAKEALSRVGPTTERLSDGIKTWDADRQHYTTFRYVCRLAGAGPAPRTQRR